MNLAKLFETQKKLDDRIIEGKGLQGQDLLDKKILALQVELGELAQNWRGFKFWSENQEPRTRYVCELCEGSKEISATTDTGSVGETYEVYDVYDVDIECPLCEGYDDDRNPLLEEYVDCLHFILSIGNEWSLSDMIFEDFKHRADNITKQFNYVFYTVMSIDERIVCSDYDDIEECFGYLFSGFTELGEMLGFTDEQIEQAYYNKNQINHERQTNGY